jgi:hypothetical protein
MLVVPSRIARLGHLTRYECLDRGQHPPALAATTLSNPPSKRRDTSVLRSKPPDHTARVLLVDEAAAMEIGEDNRSGSPSVGC